MHTSWLLQHLLTTNYIQALTADAWSQGGTKKQKKTWAYPRNGLMKNSQVLT